MCIWQDVRRGYQIVDEIIRNFKILIFLNKWVKYNREVLSRDIG